jgi:hypothetical protein
MRLRGNFSGIVLGALVALATLAGCGGGSKPLRATGGAVFEISPEIIAPGADTLVSLGKMRSGEVVRYDAGIRNTGSEPLVIRNVSTSCGCTTLEYEKQPIAPGAEGRISIRFDSGGMSGMQRKLVEITTSAGPRPFKVMLEAEVTDDN